MNILLVDDNRYVLEGIRDGINFRELGISNVFMITSAQEAKEIIQKVKIDIVLSDIEMPGENGLTLLEWINSYDESIVTMFCTCYSDFNYAKKAIDLKCFSYYLKPINYEELSGLIRSAVEEAGKRQREGEERKYVEYWKESEQSRTQRFFSLLMNRFSPLTDEDIERELEENHLPFGTKDPFLVCLLETNSDTSGLMQLDESMQLFLIKNIADELLAPAGTGEGCAYKRYYDLFVLIYRCEKTDEGVLRECLSEFAEKFSDYISPQCRVFYRTEAGLSEIRGTVDSAIPLIDNAGSGDEVVICLSEENSRQAEEPAQKVYLDWDNYSLEADKDFLIADFRRSLKDLSAQPGFRKAQLKRFVIGFRQILYAKLHDMHIEAHFLFADPESERIYQDAFRSVGRACEYAEHVLNEVADYAGSLKKSDTVIGRVKDYIDRNYCNDIGRQEIGDLVFLDFNYVSLLFKQEYGIPLHQYILNKRVARAKELLANSQDSISDIAMQVGYPNFSYFSTLFKEKTGVTPRAFREKAGR